MNGSMSLIITRRTWIVGGAASILSAACGSSGGEAVRSSAGSPEGPTDRFANPHLIVDADWLQQRLRNASLRVIDARASAEYQKGHLPGAINLPVVDTFHPNQPRNHPDEVDRLERLFGSKGMSRRDRVVVYDNGRDTPAARLLWTLEYLGHDDVAVLDGGLRAWQAAGGEITNDEPEVTAATFAAAVRASALHTQAQCESTLADRGKVMLDARSPEEFRGEDVRAKFGGRIPGAVNLDWRESFRPDGGLKPAAALRTLYESKGITPDKQAVAYCQTGQRSSVSYWTLRLLGYPNVANYAGSWIEWGNDPATPKVQGP
jgi:thiosulfate/3-mercaptopyruvate sulfurtransferase